MSFLEYNCSFRDNFVKRLGQVMDESAIEVKILLLYYYAFLLIFIPLLYLLFELFYIE